MTGRRRGAHALRARAREDSGTRARGHAHRPRRAPAPPRAPDSEPCRQRPAWRRRRRRSDLTGRPRRGQDVTWSTRTSAAWTSAAWTSAARTTRLSEYARLGQARLRRVSPRRLTLGSEPCRPPRAAATPAAGLRRRFSAPAARQVGPSSPRPVGPRPPLADAGRPRRSGGFGRRPPRATPALQRLPVTIVSGNLALINLSLRKFL